jgi:hypothetical protein
MMYLNHSKAEIKKMEKSLKIRIVSAILKRLPERAVNNVTYEAEQLAKRHGVKSVFNKVKRKAKSVKRKAKKSGIRFKTAITKRTRRKNYVKPNGRTIQKYRKPKSKQKFSRKQLQAQALFARRSRAGTLRR